jgi:hypothetical protein
MWRVVVFFIAALLLEGGGAGAFDRCDSLVNPVKEASQHYLGERFPWWYNVGVGKKESGCRWVKSLDGNGSVGYFQLTPRFLDNMLRPLFPDYDKSYSKQHFYAFAYYVRVLYENSPARKLWVVYQQYNGGRWVIRECERAGSWKWEDCYQECNRRDVCVWMTSGGCKEWRSACDINYEYSLNVWEYGKAWRDEKLAIEAEKEYPFW